MALNSIEDLYVEHIRDLYSAEQQIVDALPKMIDKASHDELRDGFAKHLEQTREHVRRLEQIAKGLDQSPDGMTCKGMKGLLEEGKEVMDQDGDERVIDAALISAAQRVEHYEMAAYGCARTYAESLGRDDDVDLLQRTLDEEAETDEKLTQLAESIVNPDAEQEVSIEHGTDEGARAQPGAKRRSFGAELDSEARP